MKTYDFKEVAVIIGGRIMSGFDEGDDVIMIGFDNDHWTTQVGADGEVTRSKGNNHTGTLTIKLKQTSESNDILNGFYQSDRLANSGKFPILIKDNSGSSLYIAEEAWIKKAPGAGFGANAGAREWVISIANLVANTGGN